MTDPLDAVFDMRTKLPEVDFPGKRPLRVLDVALSSSIEPADDEWDSLPLRRILNGVETEFFTIGHLGAAVGRRSGTIRSWEAAGKLPLSKYRTSLPNGEQVPGKSLAGRRLYTRAQIEAVIVAAHQYGLMHEAVMKGNGRNVDWKGFAHAVLAAWKTSS